MDIWLTSNVDLKPEIINWRRLLVDKLSEISLIEYALPLRIFYGGRRYLLIIVGGLEN